MVIIFSFSMTFKIEGIKGRFISPSVENDTAENLEKKSYQFSLGGTLTTIR